MSRKYLWLSFAIMACLVCTVYGGHDSSEESGEDVERDHDSHEKDSDETGNYSQERYGEGKDSVCQEKRRKGRCDGRYERWYYNRRYKECRQFIYRGCGGNRNRFRTQRLCQKRCVDMPSDTPERNDRRRGFGLLGLGRENDYSLLNAILG